MSNPHSSASVISYHRAATSLQPENTREGRRRRGGAVSVKEEIKWQGSYEMWV